MEIVSVLCKHIILNDLPKNKARELAEKIIVYLESSYHEEYEAALESIHNLMLSQENEINIEGLLPKFLNSLVREIRLDIRYFWGREVVDCFEKNY